MNGKLYQKNILSLSLTKNQSLILDILLLLLAGVIISTLRAHLRIPLNIPGRQGIIVMAILISARMLSEQRFASTLAMIGASAMMVFPFMGFKDPTLPAIYIAIGLSLDFLWKRLNLNLKSIFIAALFGGLVYMLIPIFRLGLHYFSIYIVTSFIKHGIVIPIIFHFLFGAIGTLGALGVIKAIKSKKHSAG